MAGLTSATESLWSNVQNLFGGNAVMTSGYRTPAQNAAAGGALHSDHLSGTAFDFDVPGLSSSQIGSVIAGSDLGFGKMILYGGSDSHVHLSSGAAGTILQSQGGKKYSVLSKGQALLNKAGGALKGSIGDAAIAGLNSVIPGAGSIVGGITGLGSQGSWFDQFKKWITDTHFFERLAIAFVAFIFLFAAFYLLGSGNAQKIIQQAVKA